MTQNSRLAELASAIYEATRLEASWSQRPIVPPPWSEREPDFQRQFISIIGQYLTAQRLPTPEEAHQSWVEAYTAMGWKYGPTRDPVAKTHPDMLPFAELPKDERDKDAIFLAFVWLARQVLASVLR